MATRTSWIQEKWDEKTDVLVAGSGLSGVATAIEAHDTESSVIILEKMPKIAGASWITAGIVLGAGTSVQKQAGIEDSPEAMYQHWMQSGGGLADPQHIRIIADKSAEAVEWMIKFGAQFLPEGLFACPWAQAENSFKPFTTKRAHHQAGGKYTGSAWLPLFKKALEERKIKVMVNTSVVDLMAVPGTKEVVGVKAVSNEKPIQIKARKATVLACGSIMRNLEMVKRWLPIVPPYLKKSSSPAGSTGDGIRLAQRLDADVINMSGSYYGLDHDLVVPCETYFSHRSSYPSILVNTYGRRFANETRQEEMLVAARQPDYIVYQIFDDEVRKKLEPLSIHHRFETEFQMGVETRKERLREANSVGDLASKIGIDAEILTYTVNTWNRHAEREQDPEFGRTEAVGPLKTPPFYAFKGNWRLGSSQSGGLRVNTKFQVIDVAGKVIPRLYAVGRTASGPFGKYYPEAGAFITHCVVSGRIAGLMASSESPNE